jgi:hypothetical protein
LPIGPARQQPWLGWMKTGAENGKPIIVELLFGQFFLFRIGIFFFRIGVRVRFVCLKFLIQNEFSL